MGKKRKHAEQFNDATTRNDAGSGREDETPVPAKKMARTTTSAADDGNAPAASYALWLIAKPKNLSVDELKRVAFPRRADGSTLIVESSETSAKTKPVAEEPRLIECRFQRPASKMFHVELKNEIQSVKQLKCLRPAGKVRGVMWVNRCAPAYSFTLLPESEEIE